VTASSVAPAKINLALRVLGRRPDGYHELESVFLPLDLADRVTVGIRPAAEPSVTLAVEADAGLPPCEVPDDERNLAHRAASAFLAEAGLRVAVDLRLVKRIPAAAGLGGGSSDAAAVLRQLAAAHPSALAPTQIRDLALRLGADVPFFLTPGAAFVSGIGERIEALPDAPALHLLLANPGRPLATADVFRAHDDRAPPPAASRTDLRAAYRRALAAADPVAALAGLIGNDLEPAAVHLCEPVQRLRERLLALGALGAGVSGSGPTVFGVFRSEAAAAEARDRLGGSPPQWARVAIAAKAG